MIGINCDANMNCFMVRGSVSSEVLALYKFHYSSISRLIHVCNYKLIPLACYAQSQGLRKLWVVTEQLHFIEKMKQSDEVLNHSFSIIFETSASELK